MNATAHIEKIQSSGGVVVGVDIAKSVFQLCVADTKWRRLGKHRLSRSQFERWFDNRDVALVVMEACGMAAPLEPLAGQAWGGGDHAASQLRASLPQAQ